MSNAPEETDPSASPATPAPMLAADDRPPAPELDGAQRRHLRGLAHPLKPIIFVGEGGISQAVVRALDEALTSHELVKIRLRQPGDKKASAAELAKLAGAALCGVVGHTVVLYRPHPKDPQIELPNRR